MERVAGAVVIVKAAVGSGGRTNNMPSYGPRSLRCRRARWRCASVLAITTRNARPPTWIVVAVSPRKGAWAGDAARIAEPIERVGTEAPTAGAAPPRPRTTAAGAAPRPPPRRLQPGAGRWCP